MRRYWAIFAVIGVILLFIGGCGNNEPLASSSTPESEALETTIKTYFDPPPTPFTVGATVRVRDEVFENDFSGQLITSKSQLGALNLHSDYNTAKYTDEYFENNALVVAEIKLISGSIQVSVSTVMVKHETMTVYYRTAYTEPFTQDMAYWRILLEIENSTRLSSISTIKGIRSGGYTPSSSTTTTP